MAIVIWRRRRRVCGALVIKAHRAARSEFLETIADNGADTVDNATGRIHPSRSSMRDAIGRIRLFASDARRICESPPLYLP